jgi:hypothetical protein
MLIHIITNDNSFRKLLNELDEEKLRVTGWQFVHVIDMRARLNEDDLNLAYFIADNYGDIQHVPSGQDHLMLSQLEEYLFRLPREEIRELYHDYIQADCVIEDLMELDHDDRIALIADLKKCEKETIQRFDTVFLN